MQAEEAKLDDSPVNVSAVSPPAPPTSAANTPTNPLGHGKPVAGVLTAFLSKLWKMTLDKNDKLCGWSEDGSRFEVRSDRFEEEMIKKHFNNGNIMTFVRQLHFYGFRKTGEENGKWSFSHPKFRRDSPHLLHQITRKTRTTQSDIAERESLRAEVIELRKEMTELRQLLDMRKEISELRDVVMSMQAQSADTDASKKPSEADMVQDIPPPSPPPPSAEDTETAVEGEGKRDREESDDLDNGKRQRKKLANI